MPKTIPAHRLTYKTIDAYPHEQTPRGQLQHANRYLPIQPRMCLQYSNIIKES